MGAFSRSKGKRGEREVRLGYVAAGFTRAERNLQDGQEDGDIAGVGEYVEVRRRETIAFSTWVAECRRRCKGKPWALWTRRSGEPWAVTIEGKRYLELIAAEKRAPKRNPLDESLDPIPYA